MLLRNLFGILLLVAATALSVPAQAVDREIDSIRKAYAKANSRIADAERDPESAGVYVDELVLNALPTPWPAVGIYNSKTRFFYDIRGEGPYPDRLFRITVRTERSARIESEELLFDGSGKMIFYFSSNGEKETRAYFAGGRAIRLLDGTTNVGLETQSARNVLTIAQKRAASLSAVFRSSHE